MSRCGNKGCWDGMTYFAGEPIPCDECQRLRHVDSFMEHEPSSPIGSTVKPAKLKAVQGEINKLRAENEQLKQRAEKAERELDEAHGWIARAMMKGCCGEETAKAVLQKTIDKRDLQQQIKALEWVLAGGALGWHEERRIKQKIQQLRTELDKVSK